MLEGVERSEIIETLRVFAIFISPYLEFFVSKFIFWPCPGFVISRFVK